MTVIAGGHIKAMWKYETCDTCGLPWPCPPAAAAFRQFFAAFAPEQAPPPEPPTADDAPPVESE